MMAALGAADFFFQAAIEFAVVDEPGQAVMCSLVADFLLRFLALGDIQGHSNAAKNASIRVSKRLKADVKYMFAAPVFEARGDSVQRRQVLLDRCFLVLRAAQKLVNRLSDGFRLHPPMVTQHRTPVRSDAQALIGGPEKHRHLLDHQPEMSLRGSARRDAGKRPSSFEDA